ncbi:hypothetical protein [Mycobacterium sp.]|uniref:hypothetical protein n=1 Tax=Mycobacterium sp. TaxID=1785 RepID=UPI003D6BB551
MTTGIEVAVRDGFAVIDFIDPSLRGPALAKLAEIGGGDSIEPLTRGGARKGYRVPEGNAREAGLLIDSTHVDALEAASDSGFATALAAAGNGLPHTLAGQRPTQQDSAPHNYPDGAPDDSWHRAELDAYAQAVKGIDITELPNKAAVLAAINERTS